MSNTNQLSVLSLVGTYRLKATAACIFWHPNRDRLSHGLTAKATQEGIIHTKVNAHTAGYCWPFLLLLSVLTI